MDDCDALVNKIKVLKTNEDYRYGDTILHRGFIWERSIDNILLKDDYKDTILRTYLEKVKKGPCNLALLNRVVREHQSRFPKPDTDTLVIHVRAGDVCVHDWFMSKDYVTVIASYLQSNPNIKHVSFVIAFNYGNFTERNLWIYDDDKHQKNVTTFKHILIQCMQKYPNLNFNVISNDVIDADFVYMIYAKHFVPDHGGFSYLIQQCRLLLT